MTSNRIPHDSIFVFSFLSFQFLLTPPDEGPRVKGQRIKLQDIVEGMYNPLSSNNGCWISRESSTYESSKQFSHYFHSQLMSFFIKINGAKSHYWPLVTYPRGYWCRIQHTWVRFSPFSRLFLNLKSLFNRSILPTKNDTKVFFFQKGKKGHLFAASFVIVDGKNLPRPEKKNERERKKVFRLFDGPMGEDCTFSLVSTSSNSLSNFSLSFFGVACYLQALFLHFLSVLKSQMCSSILGKNLWNGSEINDWRSFSYLSAPNFSSFHNFIHFMSCRKIYHQQNFHCHRIRSIFC